MSTPNFFPIPASALGGAIAVNFFAALATLALVSVVLRITWVAIWRRWSPSAGEPQEYVFFNTQLGRYAACLILAMMFNVVAGIFGLPWLVYGGIQAGSICLAQALLMAIGNIAGGYFTIAIAVHTFGSLVLQKRQSAIICRSTIALGWVLSLVMATAPLAIRKPEGSVYGPDGLICDIRTIFPKEQFFFHLLPILLFSILAAILYSLIFLVLRGTLTIRGGVKIMLNPDERWKNNQGVGENYHRFVARVARSMLWYPVAYIALLVPYSLLRLFAISGFTVPFAAMIFAFVCWYLLPIVDVLLLYNTFRVLAPAFDGVSTIATNTRKSRDIESIAGSAHLEKFSPTESQRRSHFEQKIDLYRSRGPSSNLTHERKASEASVASSQQSLLSQSVVSTIADRYITTATPPPAMKIPGRESITSLTMPPRRPSNPPTSAWSQKFAARQGISQSITEEPARPERQHIARKTSNSTFGQRSSRATSWVSEWNSESPTAENITRQQQSPRTQMYSGRPMVYVNTSPLNTSYYPRSPPISASGYHSRSPSMSPTMPMSSPASPPQRLRPLLLSQSPRSRADTNSIDTSSFYSTG